MPLSLRSRLKPPLATSASTGSEPAEEEASLELEAAEEELKALELEAAAEELKALELEAAAEEL